MTYSPYQRRSYGGGAAQTVLASGITNSDTSLTVTDGASYPASNFWIVIDRGLSTEEKVFVTTRTTNTFSGLTRAGDGTSGVAHDPDATVQHCWTAIDADEANAFTSTPTTKGDLVTRGATAGPLRLPAGTNGLPLLANSGVAAGLEYAQLGTGGIADLAVATGKLADDAVTQPKIGPQAVGTTEIADLAVTSGKIAVGTIVNGNIAGETLVADRATTVARAEWVPVFATTAARDAALTSPTEGMECFVTGTNTKYFYSGSSWKAAYTHGAFDTANWTATMTATGSNPSIGSGATRTNRWRRLSDNMIRCHGKIVLGSGPSNGSGIYLFNLPVAMSASYGDRIPIGTGIVYDSNLGSTYACVAYSVTASHADDVVQLVSSAAVHAAGLPFDLAQNDEFSWSCTYEAA